MSVKHQYPPEIAKEASAALKGYPELHDVFIEFKWGAIASKSFMLAQPVPSSLLLPRAKRRYQIIMKQRFFVNNPNMKDGRVPHEVIVGWLAHELGHVLDYKDRSSWNLMWFGVKYYFFSNFLRKAEITADRNAVERGYIHEIVESKEFGRNPLYFPSDYIKKLNKFYPSVATVRKWVLDLAPKA
ncbi:MAG: hypothetical protein JJ975_05250 [Bacteroidia bacterium]|nr:hypothetical protein [Bacteroidia bacterium]